MTYIVDTDLKSQINWSARGHQRVLQNVLNLISTFKYEVAYDRLLGISSQVIDKPTSQISGLLTAEIIEQVERFEPRAKVSEVFIFSKEQGELNIKVVVDID